MDSVDVRLLRTFLALMAEKNVTRAAEKLDASQPATSHSLARLRLLFGDPLLLRSGSGMVPTARAVELESQVRELLQHFEQVVDQPEPFNPASSTRTFVLTVAEFGLLAPSFFERVRRQAPHARVEVRAPNAERALQSLESGEIDLRIAWLLTPAPSLRSMHLYEDRIVCIAHRDHPEVQGQLSLEQFLRLPHARTLSTSHVTTSLVIDAALEALGKKLEPTVLVHNFLTIPAMLKGTDIIATLPFSQAELFSALFPLQILEPPLKLPRIRYAAYWHERSQRDEGHRWLRSVVMDAAGSLPPAFRTSS
jgi:DNA-binding transcriptional LysR family regulator